MLNTGSFERRLNATGTTALVVGLVFFGALAYWQAFRVDLASEDRNPRVLSAFYDPNRGRILDRDGNVLAESLPSGVRHYTDASTAHLVGYLDPRYGSQGIELAFNEVLSGTAPSGWAGAIRRRSSSPASGPTPSKNAPTSAFQRRR